MATLPPGPGRRREPGRTRHRLLGNCFFNPVVPSLRIGRIGPGWRGFNLEGEGKPATPAQLKFIHQCKTAALLTASVQLGAMSANATPAKLAALGTFGQSLGLAFQVIDDILDITQTSEKLGKSAGKDIAAQKATYPAVFGLEKSRKEAKRLTTKARTALKPLGRKAEALHAIADYLLSRDY